MRRRPSVVVEIRPAALDATGAAAFVALSVPTMQRLVRQGQFPMPRQLSARRVVFLVRELEAWLEARPVAMLPPPPNVASNEH
ncbi:AlpA family transcriptional regulator [Acidovorax sp. A1169]|uniref:helix-turn-helix transcriptional regulator n=1 Tax=Acidovorax sp. A1169 TaxID=3059524 RepID=UPI002737CC8F|nr:helix-turn-helix domain-containing protein [Acidovorax sp. A1169]MDP4075222.1 helix-turn-helix domain-containing protein [Acidovorax sp. A1169]